MDDGANAVRATVEGEDGGVLVGLDGALLSFHHPRAFPPGRPLTLQVHTEAPMELTGRTVGSKKQDDGGFLVRVRLTNLRKAHRAALTAALG